MNFKTIAAIVLCSISASANAQTEIFDILSFSPPAGYERKQGKAGLQFSRVTNNQSLYCSITIYVSRASGDDAKQEFTTEWNELIKKPRNVDIPAEIQTTQPDHGWSVGNGISAASSDKGNYVISLLSITGHKRTTSIMIIMNSDSFNPDLEKFLPTVVPQTDIAESLAAGSTDKK